MKPEINLENKAKLFAQYWGQEIIYSEDYYPNKYPVNSSSLAIILEDNNSTSLCLKDISSITDTDAIQSISIREGWELFKVLSAKDVGCCGLKIRKPYNEGEYHYNEDGYQYSIDWLNISQANTVDFLRSKGYALPWMGLSVEEMVEAGWIKLQY